MRTTPQEYNYCEIHDVVFSPPHELCFMCQGEYEDNLYDHYKDENL